MRSGPTRKYATRAAAWLLPALALPLAPTLPAGPAWGVPSAGCDAGTGPYQRELETHLGLDVDGVQSEADCEAIRSFQLRADVEPADGYAGVPAYRAMLVVEVREDPNERGECPVVDHKVICVDLTRQLLWVQEGWEGRVIFDPVPIRGGHDGLVTGGGWHRVYQREDDHFATIRDGEAEFAGTYEELLASGAGGCVTLRDEDARRLWRVLAEGDWVYVFGTEPEPPTQAELIAEGFGADEITPSWHPDDPVG
ncbi:murein L,D-transpeptidase [Streptomyces sp. B6B3]|uniref:murein L,D-transpeptidase n=1 Tax=Streptomyces sp. B6B3 TaxID=3153570 RepID=UPI00325EC509